MSAAAEPDRVIDPAVGAGTSTSADAAVGDARPLAATALPDTASASIDTSPPPHRSVWLSRALFGGVIGLYLLSFPYHPALRSPNELCRLWQTRALVEFGTIDLNRTIQTYGYVGDLSRKDGKLYPSKAPLLSFAAVPLYWVLRVLGGGGLHAVPEVPLVFWSRLLLTIAPTLVLLVFIRRFLRAFVPQYIADGVTATYALGTLAFSYSLLFMSHQTTAVLVFSAFYVLWRSLRGDWKRPWVGFLSSGALASATVAAEYTGALPVLALLVYGVIAVLSDSSRSLAARLGRMGQAAGLAIVGALPFVAFLMWYHQAAFGHPLESGYKYLNDAGYQPWHLGGFLGIRYPDPRAFVLSFFSPLRGFFTLAPFLLVALPALGLLRRAGGSRSAAEGRALLAFTVLLLVGYTYFTSSFSYDSWGWTTGPRHLTPLVPFLLLPVALGFEWLRTRGTAGRILGGAAAGLCAGAVIVTGAVSLVDYIPDVTSNPFFGLALPLFEAGYLPPSVFAFFGIPNPTSGLILLALLGVSAMFVFALLVPRASTGRNAALSGAMAGALVCAAYLSVLAAATEHDDGDKGAQGHLRSAWIAPPGAAIDFWPEKKR